MVFTYGYSCTLHKHRTASVQAIIDSGNSIVDTCAVVVCSEPCSAALLNGIISHILRLAVYTAVCIEIAGCGYFYIVKKVYDTLTGNVHSSGAFVPVYNNLWHNNIIQVMHIYNLAAFQIQTVSV